MNRWMRGLVALAMLAATDIGFAQQPMPGDFNIETSDAGVSVTTDKLSDTDASMTQIVVCVSGNGAPHSLFLRGKTVNAKLESLIINVMTHQQINVRITGPADTTACAHVGLVDFLIASATNGACRDVMNTQWGGDVILTNLQVSGDVGSLRVHGISQASIGGSITGNVTGNAIEIVDRGAGVTSTLQNVTVGGAILGNVLVEAGAIQGPGLVVNGAIGSAAHPVTVSVKSDQFITTLVSAAFYGTLRGPGTGTAPTIANLLKTATGPVVGSLKLKSLNTAAGETGLRIAGDLDGAVSFTGGMLSPIVIGGAIKPGASLQVLSPSNSITVGGIAQGGTLRVNGSLASGRSIVVGGAGTVDLGGQVIINADNSAGTWTGPIIVGSNSLSPAPAYPTPSALLGSGAVGLVPFQLYRQDCQPPQLTSTSTPKVRNSELVSTQYPPLRLRFYGPVRVAGGGTNATGTIRVFQGTPPAALDDGIFEEEAQGAEFTGSWVATLGSVAFNAGRTELQLSYTGGTPTAGAYYVTNMGATTALECDLGLSADPAVAPFTYRFEVTNAASGCGSAYLDYNGDDTVNPDDIGDFISDYFTMPKLPGPGGYATACAGAGDAPAPYAAGAYRNYGYKADFTKDTTGCGEPNPDDLGDWITAYFNDCL